MPAILFANLRPLLLLALTAATAACSQEFTVSVNDQAVYDPEDRLITGQVADADLQGCINLTMRQRNVRSETELTVLSCPNSEVSQLDRIGRLVQLRFLDLGNNIISNITPLEDLPVLGGLNLMNNALTDIGPLFNIPSLVSVNLTGNNGIPCNQLEQLKENLGDNLTPPDSCRN